MSSSAHVYDTPTGRTLLQKTRHFTTLYFSNKNLGSTTQAAERGDYVKWWCAWIKRLLITGTTGASLREFAASTKVNSPRKKKKLSLLILQLIYPSCFLENWKVVNACVILKIHLCSNGSIFCFFSQLSTLLASLKTLLIECAFIFLQTWFKICLHFCQHDYKSGIWKKCWMN